MAKVTLLISGAPLKNLTDFFDGFSDDDIASCKCVKKQGIKATYEVETDLEPTAAADHCKAAFRKGSKAGSYMNFSIQPEGFFG